MHITLLNKDFVTRCNLFRTSGDHFVVRDPGTTLACLLENDTLDVEIKECELWAHFIQPKSDGGFPPCLEGADDRFVLQVDVKKTTAMSGSKDWAWKLGSYRLAPSVAEAVLRMVTEAS